jgi:hypothetical protein
MSWFSKRCECGMVARGHAHGRGKAPTVPPPKSKPHDPNIVKKGGKQPPNPPPPPGSSKVPPNPLAGAHCMHVEEYDASGWDGLSRCCFCGDTRTGKWAQVPIPGHGKYCAPQTGEQRLYQGIDPYDHCPARNP